jgi:hypothetical protein
MITFLIHLQGQFLSNKSWQPRWSAETDGTVALHTWGSPGGWKTKAITPSKYGLARTKNRRTGGSPGRWLGLLLSTACSLGKVADRRLQPHITSTRCLGLRVWQQQPPEGSLQANGHGLGRQNVLAADVVGWGFVDSEAARRGWGVMLFELVSRGRPEDWEVGRLVSFQLRTNRAANTVPDRPGPLPSRLGRAMRHEDTSGHPAPAEPNISAGNAPLQTGGHFSWSDSVMLRRIGAESTGTRLSFFATSK